MRARSGMQNISAEAKDENGRDLPMKYTGQLANFCDFAYQTR
jgi:hypothetical protein